VLAWFRSAILDARLGSGALPIELRNATEAAPHAAEQRSVHGMGRLGQPIVGKLPVTGDLDQACTVEIAKVARNSGLGNIEQLDQVAHAELTGHEQAQNPNSSWVGESLEEMI
jgi:hypothetical protein